MPRTQLALLAVEEEALRQLEGNETLPWLWNVFTRYGSAVKDGQRFENILWRLWYKVLLSSDEELDAKVYRPPTPDGTSRPFEICRNSSRMAKVLCELLPKATLTSVSIPTFTRTISRSPLDISGISAPSTASLPTPESEIVEEPCCSLVFDYSPNPMIANHHYSCSPIVSENILPPPPKLVVVDPTPNPTPHPTPPSTPIVPSYLHALKHGAPEALIMTAKATAVCSDSLTVPLLCVPGHDTPMHVQVGISSRQVNLQSRELDGFDGDTNINTCLSGERIPSLLPSPPLSSPPPPLSIAATAINPAMGDLSSSSDVMTTTTSTPSSNPMMATTATTIGSVCETIMKSLKTHYLPDLADETVPTSEDLFPVTSMRNQSQGVNTITNSTSLVAVDTTATTPCADVAAVNSSVKTDSATAINTTSTTASTTTAINADTTLTLSSTTSFSSSSPSSGQHLAAPPRKAFGIGASASSGTCGGERQNKIGALLNGRKGARSRSTSKNRVGVGWVARVGSARSFTSAIPFTKGNLPTMVTTEVSTATDMNTRGANLDADTHIDANVNDVISGGKVPTADNSVSSSGRDRQCGITQNRTLPGQLPARSTTFAVGKHHHVRRQSSHQSRPRRHSQHQLVKESAERLIVNGVMNGAGKLNIGLHRTGTKSTKSMKSVKSGGSNVKGETRDTGEELALDVLQQQQQQQEQVKTEEPGKKEKREKSWNVSIVKSLEEVEGDAVVQPMSPLKEEGTFVDDILGKGKAKFAPFVATNATANGKPNRPTTTKKSSVVVPSLHIEATLADPLLPRTTSRKIIVTSGSEDEDDEDFETETEDETDCAGTVTGTGSTLTNKSRVKEKAKGREREGVLSESQQKLKVQFELQQQQKKQMLEQQQRIQQRLQAQAQQHLTRPRPRPPLNRTQSHNVVHPTRTTTTTTHKHAPSRGQIQQHQRALSEQQRAAEDRKWKEELFLKLPTSSFQDSVKIARAKSVPGLLSRLLKPDLQMLPVDPSLRSHSGDGNVGAGRRGFSSGMIQPLKPLMPLHVGQQEEAIVQNQQVRPQIKKEVSVQPLHPQENQQVLPVHEPTTVINPHLQLQPPKTVATHPVPFQPPVDKDPVDDGGNQRPQHSRTTSRTYRLPKRLEALTNSGGGDGSVGNTGGGTTKTPVATAVISELRVGSILGTKKQIVIGGDNALVNINTNASGSGSGSGSGGTMGFGKGRYKSKAPPPETVMEDTSGEESDDNENRLDLPKSVAQEKLRALLEAKKGKKSAQGDEQQQQQSRANPQEEIEHRSTEPISIPPPKKFYPYNLPPPNPPTSPRTTRRKMLTVEIPESLRRNLLWERQVSQAHRRGLKRSASSGDIAKGWEIPNVVKLTPKWLKQEPEDEEKERLKESRRRYLARTRTWLFEYHGAGW